MNIEYAKKNLSIFTSKHRFDKNETEQYIFAYSVFWNTVCKKAFLSIFKNNC